MQIYLPIAEMSVNAFLFLGMGGAVGFLSGMFGVGGGFLMTPLLIFLGIPPAVAVATGANQIVASSVSGVIAHWRQKSVDFTMGFVLLAGGTLGSLVGNLVFGAFLEAGQIDLLISLCYVVFLGIVGGLMLVESIRVIRKSNAGQVVGLRKPGQHNWVHGLPLKIRFRRSRLYISAIPPFVLGFFVGLLAFIMGVGGGFIMVPAMIYLLKMPTNVVVGTSLFQIIFVAALVTIVHAANYQTVDFVLALLLLIGSVVGAQFGAQAGRKLRGEQLRLLLGLLVVAVCLRLAFDLVVPPADLFSHDVGEPL